MRTGEYSRRELMVAAAAREIKDGEIVFVGMRLPLLAFAVAKALHAPRAIGLFENGIIRDTPPLAPIITMGDPPNITQAISCTTLLDVMGLLQQGRVDLGFLGAGEVDRFGNLNSTWANEGRIRLPGSGGACDIASLSRRYVVMIPHERRRFPERVRYVTSPGHGEGGDWRKRVGLRGGGPMKVITTLATLTFDPQSHEMVLATIHPGVDLDTILSETGWPLKTASGVHETAPPTPEELEAIRHFDPKGTATRGVRGMHQGPVW